MTAARDAVERFGDRMAALALVRPKQAEALPVRINRKRIYILPTGFGLFFSAILVVLLLGALNYNNNPALLLVFLVTAVAHNSLVQAHLLLSGVRLKSIQADPVHAGQAFNLRLLFDADGQRLREGLEILHHDQFERFDLAATGEHEATLSVASVRRGWQDVGRLRLSTLRTLGLARAWCWLRPDTRLLVYPAPETEHLPFPDASHGDDVQRTRQHGEQPHHLRDYRTGDSPRQIAWKTSARADRLLVREYEASAAREIEFDWYRLPGIEHEARIRRLTRWVLDAERAGIRYALKIPGEQLGPDQGPEHRHACLRALALMPPGMDAQVPRAQDAQERPPGMDTKAQRAQEQHGG